jgi:hypothetical protein
MRYGLIGAGPVNQYLAAKLPRLGEELGPVVASSHRLASRIVNTLRAGEAKRFLSELAPMRNILICAPRDSLKSLIPLLNDSSMEWKDKAVLLCNCSASSRDLNHLRERGASLASLHNIPGMANKYLLEGDRQALRLASYVVGQLRGAAMPIDPECYPLFCSAVTFSSSLFTPILEGCMSSLRGSGVSGTARAKIIEALFQQSLRMYLYSGRKSWSGTVAEANERSMKREAAALMVLQPELAHLYLAIAQASADLFKRPGAKELKRPARAPAKVPEIA